MKFQIVINWLGVSNCDFFPYLKKGYILRESKKRNS